MSSHCVAAVPLCRMKRGQGQPLVRKAVDVLERKFGVVQKRVIRSQVSMLRASGCLRGEEEGPTVARQTIKSVLNTFPYEGSVLLPKARSPRDQFPCKYGWRELGKLGKITRSRG